MSKIKKEAIVFFVFLFLISLNYAYADEFGCCFNPGAGNSVICLPDNQDMVSRDTKCCPPQYQDPQFAQYYKSSQNPNNPATYQDCKDNFFSPNTACSLVLACASGCCCSESGGVPTLNAQCKGTGQTFVKGATNCGEACPKTIQCPFGMDPSGRCLAQQTSCNDPNYAPKLKNLEITSSGGQKIFLLNWFDECSENSISYEVFRCREIGCTNFEFIGGSAANSFEDSDPGLIFDTTYTYQIKGHYYSQSFVSTIVNTATLGNADCSGKTPNIFFCLNNTPFYCDASSTLRTNGSKCPADKICSVIDSQPSCIKKGNCNNDTSNLFGIFSSREKCEIGDNTRKYCFYDRSHSTIDACFSCDTSMACYDYKTQDTCLIDNCNVGNCIWKGFSSETEIGVCVSAARYNCQWCDKKGTPSLENLRAFNDIFDLCTEQKSNMLSVDGFNCYFKSPISMKCSDVRCTDYSPDQCRDEKMTHDENNIITNPSNDRCGIGVCQNINGACVKNADGDMAADCITNAAACENDYFPPNTTITLSVLKGRVTNLNIQISDKTNANSSAFLRTSVNYLTFFCTNDCGRGHPFNASTSSRNVRIINLNAYDDRNGKFLFNLSEGSNIVKYYSQDPAKNIEVVKSVIVMARGNQDGPAVIADSFNVTDAARRINNIYYTSNQMPTISLRFFEPANVTSAKLVSNKTGLAILFPLTTELSNAASFIIAITLNNGAYTFELNAKNKNNIYMNSTFSRAIIIDNNKPTLNITPLNNSVFNTSAVTIKLVLDKESSLNYVKINSEDITNSFSTTDNKYSLQH